MPWAMYELPASHHFPFPIAFTHPVGAEAMVSVGTACNSIAIFDPGNFYFASVKYPLHLDLYLVS